MRGQVSWLWVGVLAVWGCADGYQPPDTVVIVDENNPMGPAAGSAEVAVGAPSGPLIEGGAPVSVTVALKLAPAAPVTVRLTSSDEAAGLVAPAELVFTAADWSAPKTVTLTPVDDDVATGDKGWELRFELVSDDAGFAGKPVNPLRLTTVDNDAAPSIVAAAVGPAQTSEQGGTATVTVQLSRQPKSDVLIPVMVDAPGEAEVAGGPLTFTTLNWNIAQQVVVTGKDDGVKDGDATYRVVFGPANSADEEFNSIGPALVTLVNIDGVCGNGVVDGAELCEPTGMNTCEFGQMECMVCNNACELVPGDVTGFCGDGVTQADKGEECDEPTAPCPYGQMSCMVCGPACKRVAGQLTGFCGDGMVQTEEACDAPMTQCPYGQMSCMTCRDCRSVPGQPSGFCGDGVLQADKGEECDGAATLTCMGNGTITCNAQCKNDGSQCFAIAQLATGSSHNCVVLQGGAVRCWGNDEVGQLGPSAPGNTYSAQPILVSSLSGVTQLSAGGGQTCAVAGNAVRCWGRGGWGQLGNGSSMDSVTPMVVMGLSGATQVSAGGDHTCARLSNGQARCWGLGLDGQLGGGSTSGSRPTPQVVVGPNGTGQLTNVTQIAAGEEHTCALLTNSQIFCWGKNNYGQLGVGNRTLQASPTAVVGINNATQVDVGYDHSCAVLSNGQVKCWGNNWRGQLGISDATLSAESPVVVPGISGATRVEVGYRFSCALLSSGQVRCWGQNDRGQLGDGTTTERFAPAPVSGISGAALLDAGSSHVCVALSSGQGRCWGTNSSGELTQPGGVFQSETPVAISF